MNKSVSFSAFRVLCNHHLSGAKTFYHPKRKPCTIKQLLYLLSSPKSVSVDLPILDIPYTSGILCNLLYLGVIVLKLPRCLLETLKIIFAGGNALCIPLVQGRVIVLISLQMEMKYVGTITHLCWGHRIL